MKGIEEQDGHVVIQAVRDYLLTAQAQVEMRATKVAIADYSRCSVEGTNSLRSLERWVRGFKTHSRHGCIVCIFLFVLFCAQIEALRRADTPS
jgi:hypothetical protein